MLNWIKRKKRELYLVLSDCDGMCNHCPDSLKIRCDQNKTQPHENTERQNH